MLLNTREDAEDALQLTLLRTFRRWDRAKEAPEAYSRAVLVNVCRERWRYRARHPEVTGVLDDAGSQAVVLSFTEAIDRRHWKVRRRRFAGVFGLFVVFAGIGVPIGVAGAPGGTPGRSGPVVLRLGEYTLTLPARYHLADARTPACAAAAAPALPASGAPRAAAAASGVCVLMLLAPSFRPGLADPDVPRGAAEVTIGRTRAWLAPHGDAGTGATLLVIEGDVAGGQVRDLVIGASGLSQDALVSLVSSGLSAA